ncbi:MAG: hypothetical protein ABIP29_03580, partial [Candidatus Eisenbacteria bacterium]
AGPLLAALLSLAPAARAQSIWLDRTEPRTVHVELAKPLFEGNGDGFLTFSGYFSTRLPLGERLSFVGELPVATFRADSSSPFFDSTTRGNPYLGIESHPGTATGGWFELGVRAPLASDSEIATLSGLATDVDRWEAFIPDALVLRAAGHWRADPRNGRIGADFRAAPALWFPTGESGDIELFTTYGAQILFHDETARAGFGLGGRWLLTEGNDIGVSTTHQFEAAVDFLRGPVRPGMTLRIPLEDDGFFSRPVDAVVGVTLNLVLD